MDAFLELSEALRWQFFLAGLILLASIICFVKEKHKAAVILLFVGALALRLIMTHAAPYLHDWDERFHALVAKNLMNHPLKPTLYDNPPVTYYYQSWTTNHVWLHKPPLALWQMALSYAIFGISLFATRLPSAILGSLIAVLIYRMGVLTVGRKPAYFAALFYSCAYFSLNFVIGGQMVDHVDMAFFFYATATFWAWLEYQRSRKNYWIIIIGLLAGMAVLTKWLTGLAVYAGWGITLLANKERRTQTGEWKRLILSFLVALIVFIPWQIFTFHEYPDEAAFEMEFNRKHIFEVVEGHGGEITYYLERISENYGLLIPFLILPGLYVLRRQIKNGNYRVFLFSTLGLVYVFFSLIVQTKMPAFVHFTLSIIYIALGCLAYTFYAYLKQNVRRWSALIACIILILLCVLNLDFEKMKSHSIEKPGDSYIAHKLWFAKIGRELDKKLSDDYVIFGVPMSSEIDIMFYTGNQAYDFYPVGTELAKAKASGLKIAAFDSPKMPDSYRTDPNILILKESP